MQNKKELNRICYVLLHMEFKRFFPLKLSYLIRVHRAVVDMQLSCEECLHVWVGLARI